MSNDIQKTSFWKLLKEKKIEIPIIQRDYAQGRIGKEHLRQTFLKSIKKALDNDHELQLDFIYGSVENNIFHPLDGQQRLTTLWLLHWYIAFQAGKLKLDENKRIFSNFTYETRISTREFCQQLSKFDKFDCNDNSGKIVEFIQKQTWFFSTWKQDPSIQSMLIMLGGTTNSQNNEIIDGLEKIFRNSSCDDYQKYWKKLTGNNCPIVFYSLDLLGFNLSDDLYIKMNARGEQLTEFENFKADLVNYILQKNKESNQIINKIDKEWTDIFWKFRSSENKIDKMYLSFIHRFLLNKFIATNTDSAENIEKNKLFQYLYHITENTKDFQYSGFDIYTINNHLYNHIKSMKRVLDNFYSAFHKKDKNEITELFYPLWKDTSFSFIPSYNGKEVIGITQAQRVIFHAVSSYFENNDKFDKFQFKRWMRVAWNIVENANINTVRAMISAIKLIDDLSKHSGDILSHLQNRDVANSFAKEQMIEEKEKARQIMNYPEWEAKIIEAEQTAFFNGAISFLFRTAKDENNYQYDWSIFDSRLLKSQKYFDKNGIKDAYSNNAILLRRLISFFDKWEHFTNLHYDNTKENWKAILTKDVYIEVLNKFFKWDDAQNFDFSSYESSIPDNKLAYFQNDLCRTNLLIHVEPKSYFHWWNYKDKYSIFPYRAIASRKKYILADDRNKILSELEKKAIIQVDHWQKVDNLPYYRGLKIYFTSHGKKYQWWYDLKVENENREWEKIENVNLYNLEEYLKNAQAQP